MFSFTRGRCCFIEIKKREDDLNNFQDPREKKSISNSKVFRFGIPILVLVSLTFVIGKVVLNKMSEVTPEEAKAAWLQGIPEPKATKPIDMAVSSENVFTQSCDNLVYKPSRIEQLCDAAGNQDFFSKIKWNKWEVDGATGLGVLNRPDDSFTNPTYTQMNVKIELSEPIRVSDFVFFTKMKYLILDESGKESGSYGISNPALFYGAGL